MGNKEGQMKVKDTDYEKRFQNKKVFRREVNCIKTFKGKITCKFIKDKNGELMMTKKNASMVN